MELKIESRLITKPLNREAQFLIGDREICSVMQWASPDESTMYRPQLVWSAWNCQEDPATVRAVALALDKAADLLAQWQADTGKPYKEVLQ